MNEIIKKRKTYSIDHDRSIDLSRVSIELTSELNRTVPKQEILDSLVLLLGDKTVLSKVRKIRRYESYN